MNDTITVEISAPGADSGTTYEILHAILAVVEKTEEIKGITKVTLAWDQSEYGPAGEADVTYMVKGVEADRRAVEPA